MLKTPVVHATNHKDAVIICRIFVDQLVAGRFMVKEAVCRSQEGAVIKILLQLSRFGCTHRWAWGRMSGRRYVALGQGKVLIPRRTRVKNFLCLEEENRLHILLNAFQIKFRELLPCFHSLKRNQGGSTDYVYNFPTLLHLCNLQVVWKGLGLWRVNLALVDPLPCLTAASAG